MEAWRRRPEGEAYLSPAIDACFLSLKRGSYEKEPVYIALGTDHEGKREILGFFIFGGEGESSSAWLKIFKELKERGVKHIDVVISDDLPWIEEAVSSVFPGSDRKLRIVHAMKCSQRKVRRKDESEVSDMLKSVSEAPTLEEASSRLFRFTDTWKKRYPSLVRCFRENFPQLTAFLR